MNFVEKPNPAFSNLPVCPFAKQARKSGKIECFVHNLSVCKEIEDRIAAFVAQDHHETLWLIQPNQEISSVDTDKVSDALSEKYGPELMFFSGHPESEFQMGGIYTRREPYPNIIVQKTSVLAHKELKLKNTRYYDKL